MEDVLGNNGVVVEVITITVVEGKGVVVVKPALVNVVLVLGDKLEETVGVELAEVVGVGVLGLVLLGLVELGLPELELAGGEGVPPLVKYAGGGTAVDGSLSLPVPQGIG